MRPFPNPKFAMPKRPPWSFHDSASELHLRERLAFTKWLSVVDPLSDGSDAETSPYFERNLETWRQLWRVIERSDVLVIVADVRFAALHFVPDLAHYAAQLGKGLILALNKCDLISKQLLNAWVLCFEKLYPHMSIVLFSSFPDEKLAPAMRVGSEMLSRREIRMKRSRVAAWGADQLLEAVQALHCVSKKKKAFLADWRERMNLEISEDEDVGEGGGPRRHSQFVSSILTQSEEVGRVGGLQNEELVGSHLSTGAMKEGKKKKRRRERGGGGDTEKLSHNYGDDEEDGVMENVITIGFVGHPNAGKSSIINGVFGKKVVSTSRTPGHTKHLQTMYLSESVRLCDCPGLVFPALVPREMQILAGMYPISQVRDPYPSVKYLAERVALVELLKLDCEVQRLVQFNEDDDYLKHGWTAWKICEAWAFKRGFRTAKAARLDVFRAANHMLRMALDGRIVLATVPVGYEEGADVEVAKHGLICVDEGGGDSSGGSSEESSVGSDDSLVDADHFVQSANANRNAFDVLGDDK